MIKKFFAAVVFVVILAGVLGGIKALQIKKMIDQGKSMALPPAVVSAVNATEDSWETVVPAIGSVTSVQGVTLTAESAGKIVGLTFSSGDRVRKGALLVQQDVSEERANLQALEARETLAALQVQRLRGALAQGSTSQQDFDTAMATHRQILAEKAAVQALIDKKTIRAPFSGVLGLRQVNLGQFLDAATPIANLQRLDRVYVEFTVPQQQAGLLRPGNEVRVTTDALPDTTCIGTLNAVEPQADRATRTVRMQAVLDNPGEHLRPGMFVTVRAVLPGQRTVTIIPSTAVLSAAYGSSVFVLEPSAGTNGTSGLTLRQQFVTLGERRGDFVVVTKGLAPGDTVVGTGVFKYRNGQPVVVDNTLRPDFKLAPTPENS